MVSEDIRHCYTPAILRQLLVHRSKPLALQWSGVGSSLDGLVYPILVISRKESANLRTKGYDKFHGLPTIFNRYHSWIDNINSKVAQRSDSRKSGHVLIEVAQHRGLWGLLVRATSILVAGQSVSPDDSGEEASQRLETGALARSRLLSSLFR